MNHDPVHDAMFWVGALFVFTPLLLGGIVIGVWWWTRRRSREELAAPLSGADRND